MIQGEWGLVQTLSSADPWTLFAVTVAIGLGGVLKGATGAGFPVIAVPVIASFYDARAAVAILVIPNIVTNLNQVRRYRAYAVNQGFARKFALAGGLGVGVGTVFLAWLPTTAIQLSMAAIIFVYIALRVLRPDFKLSLPVAERYVWAAGSIGGALQGAVGISAPVSVTFLNSMGMHRTAFIFIVSSFFAAMCLVQIPLQIYFEIMTAETVLLGVFALLPLTIALPIGERIGKTFDPILFDRITLFFLFALAIRMVANGLF